MNFIEQLMIDIERYLAFIDIARQPVVPVSKEACR